MKCHLVAAITLAAAAPGCGDDTTATKAQATGLTLEQSVGQHMIYPYAGLTPPEGLRKRIARGEAAGVILFGRNVRSAAQVRRTIRSLQAIRRPAGLQAPLLVMVDQEGGPVRRIPGSPRRAAAQVMSSAEARADGRAAARTLRAAGANVNLAPVADVGRKGSALQREKRIYKSPSSYAAAFAAGLESAGVRSTAKHFPGFGAAGTNTDFSFQSIGLPLKTLRSVDLMPFDRLIQEGVDLVMLSTAVYPALDAKPAALSSKWVTGELRTRLKFAGVTITDDLQTPAVKRYGGSGALAVQAVRAGIDLPLFAQSYTAAAQAATALQKAAAAGEIDRAALDAGAQRVVALRARVTGRGSAP